MPAYGWAKDAEDMKCKNVGEGTGLGLYITFQIIDAMGGKISVESELNMGTGFTITLPVYN